MKKSIVTQAITLALLTTGSTVSFADPYDDLYRKDASFYIGAYGGSTDTSISVDGGIDFVDDAPGDGYGLIAGFNLNTYVGLELGYSDYGSPTSTGGGDFKNDAYSLAVLAKYPILNRFYPYLKLGFMSWDSKDSGGIQIGGTDIFSGAGLVVKIIDEIELDFRYEHIRFDINDDDVAMDIDAEVNIEYSSVGIRYVF